MIRSRLEYIIERENLEHDEGGIIALLDLAHGDMRRVINILQSTAMAYSVITAENVYRSAGAPSPADMGYILKTLLNDDYLVALSNVKTIKETKRFALTDILTELVKRLQELEFPPSSQMFVYKELAELEYRLSFGVQEEIQVSSLIAIFIKMRKDLK